MKIKFSEICIIILIILIVIVNAGFDDYIVNGEGFTKYLSGFISPTESLPRPHQRHINII
jgi:hypothetical protein